MRFEQRLADALHEEAERRDVDVDRLWERTRARLEEDEPPRRWRRLPVLAAAAAVLVVSGGAVVLTQLALQPDEPPVIATGPVEGGIDDEFTCPEQVTHDWTRPESVTDDYFVASLRGGPAAQARTYDAARYEYEEDGDRAFLRFGNADGTLATVSEFRREGDEWVRFRTELCTGENGSIAVPVQDEWTLRPRGESAGPATAAGSESTVLVDTRSYYDNVGLVRERDIHAVPCGMGGVCLSTTESDGTVTRIATLGKRKKIHDVSWIFLPFEENPGSRPYGFWALFDPHPTDFGRLTVTLRDGRTVTAESFDVPDWWGVVYLVLAPFDEVESVGVQGLAGLGQKPPPPVTFRPEELPGYKAELHP